MWVPSALRVPTRTHSKQKPGVLSHLALFPEGIGSVKHWEGKLGGQGGFPSVWSLSAAESGAMLLFLLSFCGLPVFPLHPLHSPSKRLKKKLWVNLQSRESRRV